MRRPTDPTSTPQPLSRVDTLPEGFLERITARLPPIGEVIGGRYKLVRLLGRGAMGHVFVAENLSINRQVAIKVLNPMLLADPEFRARFQQEAEAVAAIEHPNVARFFDLVVGDPTFLVMEYVAGDTLSQRLKQGGALGPDRALAIAERLCWALDAAHATGVVHRDLKPANVILTADRESGELPKLIDWGLAKRPDADTLTRTGQIMGTPAYMSPEQVGGGAIDSRSDVYALGCVLYEMLCGRPPFVKVADDMQVLYQHVHDQPEPPSKHRPLPAAVDALLLRALAKDPAQRFQSMQELAHAIVECRRALQPAPVVPPPSTGMVPIWALAAALIGGAAIGGGMARWAGRRSAHPGPTAAEILVVSRPADAKVEIDGKALTETTPTVASGIGAGEHLVRITKSGLDAVEQHVNVRAGERVAVQVVLPPRSRDLQVTSSPSGARVYLDNRPWVGETPATLKVFEDDFHELRLEKMGYETETIRLTPEDKRAQVSVELSPERQPRGEVSIDSNGTADVWIDGGPTGFTTPTLAFRLPVGPHIIEVRDSTGNTAQAKVNVHQGETLHVTLEPRRTTP